jgi:UDP-N-acetylglucosamine acyltransferase
VHPTAVVGPDVVFEGDVRVGAYSVLQGSIRVGAGSSIAPHCVIGSQPKIRDYDGPVGQVVIGARVVVSELCAIDAPTATATELADGCYIMPHCYIGHDCRLGKFVTLTAGCSLGGHVWIGERATLGLGTVVHQFSCIGALAMTGMSSVVNRDVPPFAMICGNPGRRIGVNRVGLQRVGIPTEKIRDISDALDSWTPPGRWSIDTGSEWVEQFASVTRRPLVQGPKL